MIFKLEGIRTTFKKVVVFLMCSLQATFTNSSIKPEAELQLNVI